jgi:DNA-binding Lrp family transcriptional regulator
VPKALGSYSHGRFGAGNGQPLHPARHAIQPPTVRATLRHSLDDLDRRILAELQADGRMTNVELARRVGISPPPCLRRVKALEDAGFIRGYRARLDHKMVGFDVTCFAMVQLKSTSRADIAAFEARIRDWGPVRAAWSLSGDVDFLLQCIFPSLEAFQTFVSDLTSLPNIAQVRTALALGQSKDAPSLPI